MTALDPTVAVAAIVALPAVLAVVITPFIAGHYRRVERKEDWARQDEVADRLKVAQDATTAATQRVAAAQVITTERVAEVAVAVRDANSITDGKLDQIHTLVNSNLTSAKEDQLDEAKIVLVSLEEIVDLKRNAGIEPSETAMLVIQAQRVKIAKLVAEVDDRLKQTQVGERQR